MKQNDFVQELRKDIKVIKKDLRAISIKTRTMARALEVEDEPTQSDKMRQDTTKIKSEKENTYKWPKSSKPLKQNSISWLSMVIGKIKNWLGNNK
tara:strand:+ start:1547 stop:1831 length:285 start_codon:yes stop_codon:yes gene_type:complete